MKDVEATRNDEESFQIEWRGILLTLRLNEHHGISGSIADKDGKKIRLLEFHGLDPKSPFPMAFHETTLDQDK